jgi:hypothetical protein
MNIVSVLVKEYCKCPCFLYACNCYLKDFEHDDKINGNILGLSSRAVSLITLSQIVTR